MLTGPAMIDIAFLSTPERVDGDDGEGHRSDMPCGNTCICERLGRHQSGVCLSSSEDKACRPTLVEGHPVQVVSGFHNCWRSRAAAEFVSRWPGPFEFQLRVFDEALAHT